MTKIKKNNFFFKEEVDGKSLIKSKNGKVLETHFDKPFSPLDNEIANLLLKDFDEQNIQDISQIRLSYIYCLLSTLIEFQRNNYDCGDPECKIDHKNHSLDIDFMIQWDRAFRLDPNPELMMKGLNATEKLRDFLGKEYVDLPLNYSGSIDEMNKNKVEFVPKNTIDKIKLIVEKFTPAERFSVDLIFNDFERISISLTSLLIAKIINACEYANSIELLLGGKFSDKQIFDKKTENLLQILKIMKSKKIEEFL